jgi:hypothetical protein
MDSVSAHANGPAAPLRQDLDGYARSYDEDSTDAEDDGFSTFSTEDVDTPSNPAATRRRGRSGASEPPHARSPSHSSWHGEYLTALRCPYLDRLASEKNHS